MKKGIIFASLIISGSLLLGCSVTGGNEIQKEEQTVPNQEEPSTKKDSVSETNISYEVIALENGKGLKKVLGKEYESDWFKEMKEKLLNGLEDGGVLKVNHGGKTYLAISPGKQGSHRHEINVKQIYQQNGVIIIDAEHILPKNLAEDALNRPILFLKVKNTEKNIIVNWVK
jgi:hypothetical protein